ncbi:MAG TPA: hypothetical protein VH120_15195 [Gemmataceae bacterium]|jgi:hypothetical protein|nr:hypothetical protein [Gemmataceae bacterium]
MTTDRVEISLIEALKQALAEPGEQRLYRSGKLPGLFSTRTGVNSAAATRALSDGLLEIVRTEEKGKLTVEWVRATPAGVSFLHAHESPRAVLEELQSALQTTKAGVPVWLDGMQREIESLNGRLAAEMDKLLHRLDALSRRVEEALRRTDADVPALEDGVARAVPWAADVLHYLDRRSQSGAAGDCPLPELFAALRQRRPGVTLSEFHDGLRRLDDLRAVSLRPFAGKPEELTEPEYALLDGAKVLYYASRVL